jgi:predicted kinase
MENKPKAFLMVGLPGSGKSTWIKNSLPTDIPVISRDIIRHKLGFTKGVDHKAVLSKDKEDMVTSYEETMIHNYLAMGKDIVIDDINTGKYRKNMIKFLRDNGAEVIGVRMNTSLDTCIQRRDGQISADVMRNISKRMIPLADDEVDKVLDVVGE